MERVRDRLGDLSEKLQSEGETFTQDELLEFKQMLMSDYMSVRDVCDCDYINRVQALLLFIDKLLKLS